MEQLKNKPIEPEFEKKTSDDKKDDQEDQQEEDQKNDQKAKDSEESDTESDSDISNPKINLLTSENYCLLFIVYCNDFCQNKGYASRNVGI